MRRIFLIAALIACTGMAGTRHAAHAGLFSGDDRRFNIAMFTVGSIGFSTLAYYMYKNSPAQRAKGYEENLGLGDWYLGAYTGVSVLPAADWTFSSATFPAEVAGRTATNIRYQPGVLAGVKFGRYFDTFPWFGVELETNFSRNAIRGNQGRISPPLPNGPAKLLTGEDRFYFWAMQCNLLARYGLRPDKEVPFGRLQPYVGIGPGFEVIYGLTDSAKNFALEVQAGVRYMVKPNLGIFCEYKFSYQFAVEYQNVLIAKNKPEGTMVFDVPHHRIALGVSYHFKNLYGN